MALFKPRVFTEIFGEMTAKLVSSTPLTDINYGSVWTTMLEAAAQEDDEQYFQMLEIIRAYSLDTITGTDLDDKATEYGLTRKTSQTASTKVTIGDSAITKIETGVYSGLSGAPAGTTTINGDGSLGFPVSGVIIVGRGTTRVETVPYSSITVYANYVVFNLTGALAYDHGTDESIILSQGGNRTISSGAIVYAPENDLSPRVEFALDESATILDGEESVSNISVTALTSGSQANIPVGAITSFDSSPFSSATVYNPSRVTNGADAETDQELRDRIKSHIQSLSRGTGTSIINSVLSVISTTENKRVVSASLVEPTIPADVVKLYIDDGTGFVPSFAHIGIETIVSSATGGEKFVKLNNVPIVKAFAETQNSEPFLLYGGETLFVDINGNVETITFESTNFEVPGSATAQEVMKKINSQASSFEARKSSDGTKVKIFARKNYDEEIRVTGGTANTSDKLNFPTDQKHTIKLYKYSNNQLYFLSKDGITASIESGLTAGYNMTERCNFTVIVDGKSYNPQNVWFDPSDFLSPSSVSSLDIVTIVNNSLAGVQAIRSSNNTKFQLISNLERSASSKVRIVEKFHKILVEQSGTLVDKTTALSSGTVTQALQVFEDYIYVGMYDVRFNTVWVEIASGASSSALPIFETWNPDTSSWVEIGAFDGTNGFQNSGHIIFGRPSRWGLGLFQGVEMYWFRIQRTALSISQDPTVKNIKVSNANEVFGFSETEAVGQNKDYTFNRFIGQIELEQALDPLDVLTVGSEETRAFMVMGSTAPIGLVGGEVLNIKVDGVAQTVTFQAGDFATAGIATATEIANRIATDLKGVAVSVIDSSKVKIVSNSWSNGSLQVTGGTANDLLTFPTTIKTSLVSHFPSVTSSAGPFSPVASTHLNVVIDGNYSNNFELPAHNERISTAGNTSTVLRDSSLSTTFPLSSDLIGYRCVITSGGQSGSIRTITNYVPANGAITLSSALAGVISVGDTFQIIPLTAEQFVKFWNNKLITLLSTKAVISIAGGGAKVQITSLTSGEEGSVYVTGGTANSVLGFPVLATYGVDGYRYYTGLAQQTQWTVDGRDDDQTNYPGIRAAGIQVEVIEPVTIPIRIEVDVTTREGVTLSAISNDIKSAISAYVNNLKVGGDVIVSEIIMSVKGVSGVFDVKVTSPTENIAIADSELPRIADSNIIVG